MYRHGHEHGTRKQRPTKSTWWYQQLTEADLTQIEQAWRKEQAAKVQTPQTQEATDETP